MKNFNIVIWISRGQIINYLSGLCPYIACNSSFNVDVKTHQVPGVAGLHSLTATRHFA